MPKNHEHKWTCDFGSGSVLSIGMNSGHVVVAIDEGGDHKKRSSIGVTPETLHDLATRLLVLAETYDPELAKRRAFFLKKNAAE